MLQKPLFLKVVAFVLLFASAPLSTALAQGNPPLPTIQLSIQTATGLTHNFTVELAATLEQQAYGLMFRRELAADRGMLFPFGEARYASFWMKNTLIPLDMLFLDAEGRIAFIHRRARPHSLEPISSPVPVVAVLEIPGGEADRQDIRVGDRVTEGLDAVTQGAR
jgi:uncharacterized protein